MDYNPEVNARNILAIKEYSEVTRQLLRELETKVEDYKRTTEGLNNELALLRTQMQSLQVRLYSGGATT